MKKLMIVIICILGCLVFAGQASSAKQAPYVIGIALDLTGRAASLGIPEKRGYQMMADEFNETGGVNGRKIKLIILDNESKPAKAVLNTKKLIGVENVTAILGYSTTGSILASALTAEEGETVLVANAASEKIWKPTQKWLFNVVPSQAYACTPILIDNLLKRGSKKIAYIYIDTAYGQTGKMTFEQTCKDKGIKPAIIEKYTPGTTDVSPQITHIKSSGADGLIICGYMGDTAMVLKTARDLGIKFPIVSEYAVVGHEFIKLAGTYGEGVVSTSLKALVAHDLPDGDVQKEIAMDLYDKYTRKYETFSLYAGHAWDSMALLRKALEKVDPNLDPSKDKDLKKIRVQVRDNIENLKNIVGQNGTFNYSPDNHNGLSYGCYVPVIISKGKWRLGEKMK
ncbi:MAG: ABC transporter substrate-binding protein [Desulfobacula sp.]|uniref:ABC transporter substrate-binding protein n=1 Tax=Desulfobacula sp. TaxID=2593537 RepID=UPI0025C3E1E0|nr:ABC transporter substrate-binding protein [Desulfobacula sp.]MCD4721683.1 ABC transporter substrate-binding protein [Desulfobacula sp.]